MHTERSAACGVLLQERLAKCHGSQCGFCTPGMVMSIYTLLRNHPKPTSEQMTAALSGKYCHFVICRYVPEPFSSSALGMWLHICESTHRYLYVLHTDCASQLSYYWIQTWYSLSFFSPGNGRVELWIISRTCVKTSLDVQNVVLLEN